MNALDATALRKNTSIESEIRTALENIRPLLALHKGDIEYHGFEASTGVVRLRLKGTCAHCRLSELTLKNGVEEMLKERIHGVTRVENVGIPL